MVDRQQAPSLKRGGLQRQAVPAITPVAPSAFADVLWLQRMAGNQAVCSAIQRKPGEATDDVLTHIFAGEVRTDSKNRVEKVVGYHSEAEKGTAVVEVPDKRTEVTGYAGIYHAEPVRDKATKTVKSGGSSFYPRNWDRSAVTLAIEKSQTLTGTRLPIAKSAAAACQASTIPCRCS